MATTLLSALPDRSRAIGGSTQALDAYLDALLAQALIAWPGVHVPAEDFLRYVAARIPAEGPLLEALATLSSGDLYLACACASGEPAALAVFQRTYGGVIERALQRLRLGEADRQDLTQALWERLFVGKTITQYGGRGQLRSWVRATAVHAGLNALEKTRTPGQDDDVLARLPSGRPDAELEAMRVQHKAAFEEALAAAVKTLSASDRALLLQHHADGLTLDQLAVVYGVDRRTIARRIAATKQALVALTESGLRARLKLDPLELSSLQRLVRSQLKVSLFRLLREC